MSRIQFHFICKSLLLILRYGTLIKEYTVIPTPDIYCATTVASAAPATPRLRPITNHKSKTILSITEIARNTSGIVELPIALSNEAK